MFYTPILLIAFNRPDTTQQVFDRIRDIKPTKLYITLDAPRKNQQNDVESCAQVKKIVENITWDCEVKRLYATENLGFSKRIKSALDWFYEHVEQGIILEDDCLPSLSFFNYCAVLLEKHKDNADIQLITGSNFCDQPISKNKDYFIADFGYIWGWASWRRVIKNIQWQADYTLSEIENKLNSVYKDKEYVNHFNAIIKANYKKRDCWDVEFFVYNLMENKKSIFPNVNLISNIGNSGTHYNNSENKLLNTKTFEIDFEKFNTDNFASLTKSELNKTIKQFNEKVNPMSFRDKLYVLKNKIKSTIHLQ